MARVFLHQFQSPLIYLLLLAGAIAFVLGQRSDSAVIFGVVLLNALIGAFQEGRAERSLVALRKIITRQARVVRDGREMVVDTRTLVPGDILVLVAGDAVPADARLLHGSALHVAEAALTGESVAVFKDHRPLAAETPLADRRSMVYAGTHVSAGRGRAIVVVTGPGTEIGRIAALAEAAQRPETPLERRVAQFSRLVILGAVIAVLLVIVVGLLRGIPAAQVFLLGMSQLVGIVPEGLPVAMTIALAVGVQRMARRRAVVRHLAAVETLGSTTVICSDKTGTLTRNEMTAVALVLPDGRALSVTGAGYEPVGRFLEGGVEVHPAREPGLCALLEAGVLCNDAQLAAPAETEPRWRPLGDPTEVALLSLAVKGGVIPEALRLRMPRRAEIPFDPDTRMMATQHDAPQGPCVIVKGAPEPVLELCGFARRGAESFILTESERLALRAAAEGMATQAQRVLAVAEIAGVEIDVSAGLPGLRGRAVLLGLVGETDPPRPEVSAAVRRCREAGIRPVMVTGDHPATGLAIAQAVGIARPGDLVVDGKELERMTDSQLFERIERVSVFARVHPAQKLRIVEAYQHRGEVVAMTGDGVNDAPALARADVGVALGMSGTEVAKEASKIVIGDDNFATIVVAVEEGRVVYANIKKAVLLLLSTSAAEVTVLLLAMALGYPSPFVPVQILWNNFVTEGLITVNLVMEPAEGDEMRRKPMPPREPLLTRAHLRRMAFMVPAIVAATLGWFVARTAAGIPLPQVRTETFTLLALCEWFNVLNCRSSWKSALDPRLFRNLWLVGGLVAGNALQAAVVFVPALGRLFHTVPLGPGEVVALGLVASLVLWVEEVRKFIVRRRGVTVS